jgi:hypothetical protein
MPNRDHMRAITGEWTGQVVERGKLTYPMEADMRLTLLEDGTHIVEGRSDYDIPGHDDVAVKFIGRFLDGFERLQLDYKNEDSEILNCGVMLFKLSNDGKTLDGEFMEFNHLDEDMISGTISLQKKV